MQSSHDNPDTRLDIGLPIASLILGIISIAFSIFLIGVLLAVAGVILGVIHLRKGTMLRGMAGWGVALSLVGILASAGMGLFYYNAYQEFQENYKKGRHGMDLETWQGVLAPDITLTALDGATITLKDLRGKRVILDFWATWCPPCVKEIPHFIRLAGEISGDELVIIGISSEDRSKLEPFIAQKGINYPIVSKDDLPSPYGDVLSIPTTFFIDRNGVIQTVYTGYHDYDALKSAATAADFQGEPRTVSAAVNEGLTESGIPYEIAVDWDLVLIGCRSSCAGDWDGDSADEILVLDQHNNVHVVGLNGQVETVIQVPDKIGHLEMGRRAGGDIRLLGYTEWGKQITVMDRRGETIWEYSTPSGVDGAHWGDLDGDGSDELIAGMNGDGGLHAVSSNGELIWKVTNIGNVWWQAVVAPYDSGGSRIFATETRGTVRVFDGQGKPLSMLRPLGHYYAKMSAARVDDTGRIQIVAPGKETVVGFNMEGTVEWTAPVKDQDRKWHPRPFACGDMDGDGTRDWVFRSSKTELMVVSPDGVKLAALNIGDDLRDFCVAEAADGTRCLITIYSGMIQGHRMLHPGTE